MSVRHCLGVDSSLGLLPWLHYPWHIGVALLIHRGLLHGLADVDAGLGHGFAGLAVEALGQRGGAVPALPRLEGQLVRHLEGLAQRQDDLIG